MTKPKGSGRLIRRKAGGQLKHGAQAIVLRKELLEQFPEIGRYTRDVYEGILRDLSPDGSELPMAKRVLLDRLMSQLTTISMIDSYLGKAGVLRADKPGIIEAHPIIETWLSLNRSIQSTLQALGLERAKIEPLLLTPDELMAEVVRDDQEPGQPEDPEDGPSEEQSGPGRSCPEKCVKARFSGAIDQGSECGAGGSGPDGQGGEE